ncbi:hypothetical protein BDN70DRAFT_883672 [Pholiota conissans]|uniref:Uncharacterized protein n=1 Tax=Pholiota conissans TaxID=109636 RepID=A0A9P5YTD6_9AGAR|nr:hypothetical protein BDN70DRAFT_883672 [Pholiota conissans]
MAVTATLPSSPTRPYSPIHTPSYPYHTPSSPKPSSSPSPIPPSTRSHTRSSTVSHSMPSPTPSSVVSFPSPSKPSPSTPNAHPYAIKTTSTALLSRSNSSAAQSANAVHRYVPPASPSPISPTSGDDGEEYVQKSTGSMGMGRKGRHRYSRSLTDGPMPVPIPPGVVNNATSSYSGYKASPSPSHHVRERARSLASESGEEDTPRRSSTNMGPPTTPLHRYSSSEPFFKAENSDFNSRRSLSNTDNNELNDEGVTLRRRAARMVKPRTRSRNSSMSSNSSVSSSASGRVREMVDELERSSGRDLEEEGTASSRSSSPTKSAFINVPGSPSKRALPHRPSVNDLFSGGSNTSSAPSLMTDKEVVAKEMDETITHVAKRNVLGREPRLLPFPPTVTPLHTGSGSPFIEQQYLQQQYHGLGDYELGFRHAASPHSQTFVVRHGPSPSNLISPTATGNGSNGKPARLLPYPPVTSETALHHPRPRRAVGVSDRDADDTSTTEGEGAYTTALESQPSTDDAESSPASDISAGVDGDSTELSMAELLAVQQALTRNAPAVSGAEAWEIELGDTVKRVGDALGHGPPPGSAKRAKANAGGASFKEIGRKAGRAGTAEKGRAMGTGRDKESLRRPGIMGLFNDMEGDERDRGIAERKGAEERVQEVEDKAKEVEQREREVEAQAEELSSKAKEVDDRARVVDEMKADVEVKGREVEEREKDVEKRLKKIEEHQLALDVRERSLVSREDAVLHRENSVEEDVEEKTQARNADLDIKSQRVEDMEVALLAREEALEQRTKDVALREEAVWNKEESLAEREKMLHKAEEALQIAKKQLSDRELGLESAERDVSAREARMREQEALDRERKEKEAAAEKDAIGQRFTTQKEEEGLQAAQEKRTALPRSGVDILRGCWGTFILPIVGEKRTPAFLSTPSTSTAPPTPSPSISDSRKEDVNGKSSETAEQPQQRNRYLMPTWAIRRDAFWGRFTGGPGGITDGYLVLMGIGMCVVVLRVLGRRGWAMRR